jgi:hypothetical protein
MLVASDRNIVFNDDSKDETADIVTMKIDDESNLVNIEAYHCKYSNKTKPGCRLDDLYEVLGQAQKNIRWLDDHYSFVERLLARERAVKSKSSTLTRFRKGSVAELTVTGKKLKNDYGISLKVYVVQPGLSKSKLSSRAEDSNDVERLFAVTDDYIKATKQAEFIVICSD